MGMGIPPLRIKNMLESNLLKSRFLVRALAIITLALKERARQERAVTCVASRDHALLLILYHAYRTTLCT